jgi:hypothetical protein
MLYNPVGEYSFFSSRSMAKPVKSGEFMQGQGNVLGTAFGIVQQLHSVGEALRQQAKKVVSE